MLTGEKTSRFSFICSETDATDRKKSMANKILIKYITEKKIVMVMVDIVKYPSLLEILKSNISNGTV